MSLFIDHDRSADDPRGPLIAALADRTVSILGYGNQGRAHGLNLRDSGVRVIIGARPSSASAVTARDDGFEVTSIDDAARRAELVIVGLPDPVHGGVCHDLIMPAMKRGAVLGFMHGFAIHFGLVRPPAAIGVVLVAPKGPGTTLRQRYLEGLGIPCLLAVQQDAPQGGAEALALAWASGLGCGRAGIVRTTFAHETETDLFGEQAVLCGGAMSLAHAAFEVLVEAGYPAELAYVECVHELKQVVDLLFERGFAGMRAAISDTAEFGALRAGPRLIDDATRTRMRDVLREIQDGTFARALTDDQSRGFPWFEATRQAAARDPIEDAGRTVRSWMPWMATHAARPRP